MEELWQEGTPESYRYAAALSYGQEQILHQWKQQNSYATTM